MSYPTTPDALTTDWLSDALGQPVTDFSIERFGEGVGVVGQVVRLHLTGTAAPATIIAKFPSPAPENRAVAATYDMYGREVRFYQSLAGSVGVRAPACYFAAHDPATEDFVLLLEDLAGYRLGDQVAGASVEDARRVVDAIARLHGETWEDTERLGLRSHNNPAQRDGMIAGFDLGWPVVLERFGELVPANARSAGTRMGRSTAGLLEEMCRGPVCLSHADVRLDNLFFGDDEVLFVDWQSICSSAPEMDLAYFLTQSLTPAVRRSEDFCARYFEALRAHVPSYDRSEFERRYRVSALYLLNYAVVIAGTLDLGNERGVALAQALIERSMTALDELDAFALLSS